MSETCCMRLAEHTGRKKCEKSPYGHHRILFGHTFASETYIDNRKKALSGCVFATTACIDNWKNLLNSDISSTRPHNMANFGPLTAEICSGVLGTPANFNGFCVLPSLLQRRRSPEANQTLHDVWASPELLHIVYIFGALCHLTEFCQVQHIQFASKSCVLLYWQRYCTALQQRASAKRCGVVQGMELRNFCRGATYILLGGHDVGHRPTFKLRPPYGIDYFI